MLISDPRQVRQVARHASSKLCFSVEASKSQSSISVNPVSCCRCMSRAGQSIMYTASPQSLRDTDYRKFKLRF